MPGRRGSRLQLVQDGHRSHDERDGMVGKQPVHQPGDNSLRPEAKASEPK
jgi:hypothetical protein